MINRFKSRFNSSRFITVFLVLNVFFFIFFWLWFFTDIHLTKWGNTAVTTSNVFELVYLTKRNIIHRKILDKIVVVKNTNIKKILLRGYIDVNSADQWWNLLYPYKKEAIDVLLNIYVDNENWIRVEKLSNYFLSLDDRKANYYYLLGLSYENLNNTEKAEEYYWKALEIESTHRGAIKEILKILVDQGRYDEAKLASESIDMSLNFIDKKICVFWGEEGFNSDDKYCEIIVNSFNGKNNLFEVTLSPSQKDNMEYLKYFRIDIPENKIIKINKINITNIQGQNLLLYSGKYSLAWIGHNLIVRDNTFFSIDKSDPYAYVIFEDEIISSEINKIILEISIDHRSEDIDILDSINLLKTY